MQLLRGEGALEVVIVQLGSCQRVVAVAYCIDKDALVGDAVFFFHPVDVGKGRKCAVDVLGLLRGNQIAADAAAVLHQIEGVQLLHLLGLLFERSKDGIFAVVNQQHGVGHLKRSDITDVQPWLDKVLDDPFGRTDSGAGAGIEFILLQIDDADQSAADLAVGKDTAGVDVIVYLAEQMSAQVGAHGAVNGGNVLLQVGAGEVDFRHHHV